MPQDSRTAEFLNKIYQNAQMASESISTISQKVEDAAMLSDLQTQHGQYSAITAKAASELSGQNQLPKEKNPMAQASAWSGIQMNTMFDKSADHIAEIMIQGSVMGIIDMTRTLKECDEIPRDIKALGYELITVEENNFQRMKNYLG